MPSVPLHSPRLTPLRYWALSLALGLAWSLVLMLPVLVHSGWPANHDGTAQVARMAAILDQWRLGHAIPVWSTHLQGGYGSPLPALYHKTSMYASAAVLGLTGSVKAALVVPVLGFLVLGFAGVCLCVRQWAGGRHAWVGWVGGAALLASNYATTDWLVRGAFAELVAMMLLPWLVAWCLRLIETGRWSRWIGPLLALLALSHAGLAYFALVPLVLAAGLALARWRTAARHWVLPGLQSIGICTVLLLPWLLPMMAMGAFARVDRLLVPGFVPRNNHMPADLLLWDPGWTWGATWMGATIQLDTVPLLLAVAYGVLVVASAWRRKPGSTEGTGSPMAALFLVGTLSAMFWLQTAWAHRVYEELPGAQFLQFSWRLLAYLTVVSVVCACMALLWMAGRGGVAGRGWSAAAGGAALAMVVATAAPKLGSAWLAYDWLSAEILEAERGSDDYAAFGEFLPRMHGATRSDDLMAPWGEMKVIMGRYDPAACDAMPTALLPTEQRTRSWHVRCAEADWTTLPVFLAPGMEMRVRMADAPGWVPVPLRRTCADPRLQALLPAGDGEAQLRFPSWRRVVAAALSTTAFHYERDCAVQPLAAEAETR